MSFTLGGPREREGRQLRRHRGVHRPGDRGARRPRRALVARVRGRDRLAARRTSDEVRLVPGLAERRPRADTAAAVAAAVAELDPTSSTCTTSSTPPSCRRSPRSAVAASLLWYVHDHYLTCLTELRWRRDIGHLPAAARPRLRDGDRDGHCVLRHAGQVHVGADVDRRKALSRSLAAADAVIVVSEYMRTAARRRPTATRPRAARAVPTDPRPRPARPRHVAPRRRAGDRDVRRADQRREGPRRRHRGPRRDRRQRPRSSCASPASSRTSGTGPRCQAAARRRPTTTNPGLTRTYPGHLDYDATDELFRRSDIVTDPVALARAARRRRPRSDGRRCRRRRLTGRRTR